MARIPVAAVISALLLLPACSRDAGDPPVVAPAPSPQDPRSRELALPKLEDGEPCPRSKAKKTHRNFGPGLGVGPAYPVGLGIDGLLEFAPPERFESREWGGQKVLWVVDPGYDGPVLIRGRQLDGSSEVRFDEGDVPPKQIWLPPGDAPAGHGWRERPSYTRVRGPGCYGYQVDGPNFSLIIVFEARPISE